MNPNVRQTFDRVDVYLSAVVKKARGLGHSIPCRDRCDACCYDIAWCTPIEAREIVERIWSMPEKTREAVVEALSVWWDKMQAAGLDPSNPKPDLRTYHRAHIACPLLDPEEHRCRVYDLRPLSCRAHYVLAPDASVCANRANVPEITTLMYEDDVLFAWQLSVVGARSVREMINKGLVGEVTPELLPTVLSRVLAMRGRP